MGTCTSAKGITGAAPIGSVMRSRAAGRMTQAMTLRGDDRIDGLDELCPGTWNDGSMGLDGLLGGNPHAGAR